MSVIVEDDRTYFQTDAKMMKARQIQKNKNVALCVDNYQIYGKATILGPWESNMKILENYRKVHNTSYEKYKMVKNEVVIETIIEEIKIWEYRDGMPYIINVDLKKNKYEATKFQLE